MPNSHYTALEEGEPRGERHDEPRADGLNLVLQDGGNRHWVNADGQRVCGAKTQKWSDNYKRCAQTGINPQNQRCHQHGGGSPKAQASPHYEGKGRSKYLPENLAGRFEELRNDPQLASVRDDIALIDLRLSMVMEGLDVRTSRKLWDDLSGAITKVRTARQQGDMDAAAQALNRVEQLIMRGAKQAEVWEDMFDLIERRRKLVDTENRRIRQSAETLSIEQAAMLVDYMVDTVLTVMDRYDMPRKAKAEIVDEAQKLMHDGQPDA